MPSTPLPPPAPEAAEVLRCLIRSRGALAVGERHDLTESTEVTEAIEVIEVIETHMSWVFLVGPQVFKLKKPVRHPFLDFSTLAAREAACREELRLNARLAPGVYRGLVALQRHGGDLRAVPDTDTDTVDTARGQTVDWLVQMRRLPRARMLDAVLAQAQGLVRPAQIDSLVQLLADFYRHAERVPASPAGQQARQEQMQQVQQANRDVLLRPQFQMPGAALALDRFDHAMRRLRGAWAARAAQGCIVDGHGDLRPEHVCLLEPPVVIDCIEFNAGLRRVDPYDELALFALECRVAGAAWVGERAVAGVARALGHAPPPALMQLYTAGRALVRARLALAHLLDAHPRTPGRWAPLARRYLAQAMAALDRLDTFSPPAAPGTHAAPAAPEAPAALNQGALHGGC